MFAASGFGIIAIFSVLSTILGEDRRRSADPNRAASYFSRWVR